MTSNKNWHWIDKNNGYGYDYELTEEQRKILINDIHKLMLNQQLRKQRSQQTANIPPIEFVDMMPSLKKIEELCERNPALKAAFERFKMVYKLVETI